MSKDADKKNMEKGSVTANFFKLQLVNLFETLKLAKDNNKLRTAINKLKHTLFINDYREKIGDILKLSDCGDVLKDPEFLKNRAIIFDIYYNEGNPTIYCRYGLKMKIRNLISLLDFCSIHGFVPIVNEIKFGGKSISNIKELYTFFTLVFKNKRIIYNPIYPNEIAKLKKSYQKPGEYTVMAIKKIKEFTTIIYPYLLGNRLERLYTNGTFCENIFVEVAFRLENEVRDKEKGIGLKSSYIKLASYTDDIKKKTDMYYILEKTGSQHYKEIPLQFTIGQGKNFEDKQKKFEKYIMDSIKKGNEDRDFIILSVNGKFSESIIQQNKEKKSLIKKYINWINTPAEREKQTENNIEEFENKKGSGNKFPLFIDSINPEIIQPAKIMYIALNMLYKKYRFRYTKKKDYLNAVKKTGKIYATNTAEIEGIRLSDINIIESEIDEIYDKNNENSDYSALKHTPRVGYNGEPIGTIIIYAVGHNRNRKRGFSIQ